MLLFSLQDAKLQATETWELARSAGDRCENVSEQTTSALQSPIDFPAFEAAVVPGDRVAVALDPNLPAIDQIVSGVVTAIRKTEAGEIDLVLWDEASDATLEQVRQAAPGCNVTRHRCDFRADLSYLAADADADPIYLNRFLVEADLVLPVVAIRPSQDTANNDVTGIFPALTDSATRRRAIENLVRSAPSRKMPTGNPIDKDVPWLLGVQLMCGVVINRSGEVQSVVAGPVEAIAEQCIPLSPPDQADLVIVTLDGPPQQQTWDNTIRALRAATGCANPDATIVVWSHLDQSPGGALLAIDEETFDGAFVEATDDNDGLPVWDPFAAHATVLWPILQNYRVMLHSQLDSDDIERLGIGVVDSLAGLSNLSRGFDSCGVVRAAGFTANR
ncbi:hypothetical protein [Rhodopirellula sp. MGV]|uniref:hypothetical protein n=1 Tax=Rhodopirellula sp. MGV TaxID=2023130 RepID=UPI000B96A06B|nr:hypothetical protein [Rhodopirellula sp. MGV]OYP28859.1 hypothetical protein CGZ80_25100 [Rhodopirellula sp. MGV]PNY37028.1 hypothetical protein C2E31_10510 [Rhodopirellula baltica]